MESSKKQWRNTSVPVVGLQVGLDGNVPVVRPTATTSDKKRHRRSYRAGEHHPVRNKWSGRRNNKWKPYDKLTWEERRALDERNARRATTRHQQRIAAGQPMAPYNTTQFLMDQHDPVHDIKMLSSAKLHLCRGYHDIDKLSDDLLQPDREISDDIMFVKDDHVHTVFKGIDEAIFLQKDFADAYARFHAEHLQTLSKDELLRDYLEMESRLENICARLNNLQENSGDVQTVQDPITAVEEKMRQLQEDNLRLSVENEQLRNS